MTAPESPAPPAPSVSLASLSGPTAAPAPKPRGQREVQNISHPKFVPTYLARSTECPLSTESETWITPLSAPAYFPLDIFHSVLHEMAQHPEQNSGLILRAEPLPDSEEAEDTELATRLGLDLLTHDRVRFIPRQPRRDARLDQRVVAYSSPNGDRGVVVKTPLAETCAQVPFYHPPVKKLAFIWDTTGADEEIPEDRERCYGRISVAYLPFPDTPCGTEFLAPHPKPPRRRSPLAESSSAPDGPVAPPATVLEEDTEEARAEARAVAERRLQRTCLALLERLHKHGHGSAQGYVKRVVHDTIIRREPFQDLYQALKERHKHLDSRVKQPWSTKVEDVKRHVWKSKSLDMDTGSPDDRLLPRNLSAWGSQDIAIAAFLMLLWKDMYPPREGSETGMEWDKWGRPPGGFVDLGCGNGLLVHVLVSEGYAGKGYELRERRTWPQYPDATRAALVELPINMPSWFPSTMEEWDSGVWPGKDECVVKEGTFLIGNHSDELTPWIPLLSLLPSTPSPYLSLPCCAHTLDAKFTKTVFNPPAHAHSPAGGFDDGLEPGASRYKAYTMWLGYTGLLCGWLWEKESLRIPSTRGWAIVARRRWTKGAGEVGADGENVNGKYGDTAKEVTDRACRAWALEQVNGVRARGAFAVRAKEGKDH